MSLTVYFHEPLIVALGGYLVFVIIKTLIELIP
jgi:hypothetical protein